MRISNGKRIINIREEHDLLDFDRDEENRLEQDRLRLRAFELAEELIPPEIKRLARERYNK